MAKVYSQTWERSLLPLAYEAEHLDVAPNHPPVSDGALLERAYRYCNAITSANSRTFYMATSLLPPDKQRAMRALYAFCRLSDDIIDCAEGDAEESLAVWRRKALAPAPPPGDLIAVAWADTRFRYQVPQRYAEQLIDGVRRDLYQRRYRTFEDMVRYAYGVASTVGLMCMHIIGFAGEYAIPYAIKLGVALQITNNLRDVGEDWRCGRVYLPIEELEVFGLSHNFMQVGYLRPHNRHQRYGNLYFVGSSTRPGTGLPMVLLSARLTTERILKESSLLHREASRRSLPIWHETHPYADGLRTGI